MTNLKNGQSIPGHGLSGGVQRQLTHVLPESFAELLLALLLVLSIVLALNEQPLKAGAALGGALAIGLYLRTRVDTSAIAVVCALSLFTALGAVATMFDLKGTVRWLALGALVLAGLLFLIARRWETQSLSPASKLGALLLFEGRLGNAEYHDQRAEFCRGLLALAQRYGRPASVLIVDWTSRGNEPESRNPRMSRILEGIDRHMLRYEIAEVVKRSVRRSDIVTVDRDTNLLFILCPDTPGSGAMVLADRLTERVRLELQTSVRCSAAVHPQDGYRLEELVSTAMRRGPIESRALFPRENPRQQVASSTTGLNGAPPESVVVDLAESRNKERATGTREHHVFK